MTIAIYPGTFDPITNGHVDIVVRATSVFNKVIVAVAPTSRKSPFIPIEMRLTLVGEVFASHHNIEVKPLGGLLVDFAKAENASCIIRGLRCISDFDYEFQQASMNRRLAPEIATLFFPASDSTMHISATMVREIVNLGGDASSFVPTQVIQFLQRNK